MNIEKIKKDLSICIKELIKESNLQKDDIFILGCSTSEIKGSIIGKDTDIDIAKIIVSSIQKELSPIGINLAVQCCEHLNRAIVVEKNVAKKNNLEIVNVIPVKNAGGGVATAAYNLFNNPVVVEKIIANAGIDIGDTSIGMHVKFVQVPVRFSIKKIGKAHISALKSRPKLIGGKRAIYH